MLIKLNWFEFMSTQHSFAVILHHTPCIYIAPMAMQ